MCKVCACVTCRHVSHLCEWVCVWRNPYVFKSNVHLCVGLNSHVVRLCMGACETQQRSPKKPQVRWKETRRQDCGLSIPKARVETAAPTARRSQGAAYLPQDWPGGRGLAPSSAPDPRGGFPLGPTIYRDCARNDPCRAVRALLIVPRRHFLIIDAVCPEGDRFRVICLCFYYFYHRHYLVTI